MHAGTVVMLSDIASIDFCLCFFLSLQHVIPDSSLVTWNWVEWEQHVLPHFVFLSGCPGHHRTTCVTCSVVGYAVLCYALLDNGLYATA